METINKCIDCGVEFDIYGQGRCAACQKKHRAAIARKHREKKRIAMMKDNESLIKEGFQICHVCHHKRHVSEFGTSQPNRQGKLNVICDRCLTSIYQTKSRVHNGFDSNYWRRRAYTVNSRGRQLLARLKHTAVKNIKMSDLAYECKPQDLAKLFTEQDGKCYYCKCELSNKNLTVDHKTPIVKQGAHDIKNMVITCRDCNYLKHDKTEEEFMLFIDDYINRFKTSRN